MKTNDEIRRDNLLIAIKKFRTAAALAEAAGTSAAYLSQIKRQTPDSKTGKPKRMGDELARGIEHAMKEPEGWMDVEHNSNMRDASINAPKVSLIQGFPTEGKDRISGETSGIADGTNVSRAMGRREIPILSLEQASKMAATVDPHTLSEGLGTVTEYKVVSAATFAIHIKGPSMLEKFEDGDVVIIDPAKQPTPGNFVLAETHAGEAIFRKYRELGTNDRGRMVFELVPLNDDFATLHSERDRPRIIGAMHSHTSYARDE
jgi:SOS-response transcriptional repressor LexA